jgi:hypothetical protein
MPRPSKQPLSFRPSHQPQYGFLFCSMSQVYPAILILLTLSIRIPQGSYFIGCLLFATSLHMWEVGWVGYIKKEANRLYQSVLVRKNNGPTSDKGYKLQFSAASSYIPSCLNIFLSTLSLNTHSPCPFSIRDCTHARARTHTHTQLCWISINISQFAYF